MYQNTHSSWIIPDCTRCLTCIFVHKRPRYGRWDCGEGGGQLPSLSSASGFFGSLLKPGHLELRRLKERTRQAFKKNPTPNNRPMSQTMATRQHVALINIRTSWPVVNTVLRSSLRSLGVESRVNFSSAVAGRPVQSVSLASLLSLPESDPPRSTVQTLPRWVSGSSPISTGPQTACGTALGSNETLLFLLDR